MVRQSGTLLGVLPDVAAVEDGAHGLKDTHIAVPGYARFPKKQFVDSVWFTRGWTLQELIAPNYVLYDMHLRNLGPKHDRRMREVVAEASHISFDDLMNPPRLTTKICAARKMSWAAHRQTSREEDLAYCLIGLFRVNMPLLYGEGIAGAFRRLQLEIIVASLDGTIFAFDRPLTDSLPHDGMLSDHPSEFASSGAFTQPHDLARTYTRTQRGLEFTLLLPWSIRSVSVPLVLLPVAQDSSSSKYVCLILQVGSAGFRDRCLHARRIGTCTPSSHRKDKLELLGWSDVDSDLYKLSGKSLARRIQYDMTWWLQNWAFYPLTDQIRVFVYTVLPPRTVQVYVEL